MVKAYEKLLLETAPYLEAACSTADLNDLLSKAPGNLPSTPPTLGASKTERVAPSVMTRREIMEVMISLGKKHIEGKKIAVNTGVQELVFQDQIQHVVTSIKSGVEWIDDTVKASPLARAA